MPDYLQLSTTLHVVKLFGVGQIEGVVGKSFFVSIIGEFNDKAPYIYAPWLQTV